jgi:hypothetical protein
VGHQNLEADVRPGDERSLAAVPAGELRVAESDHRGLGDVVGNATGDTIKVEGVHGVWESYVANGTRRCGKMSVVV